MKVKQHLKDNKKFYIGLGIGVCIAGITYAIMRGRHVRLPMQSHLLGTSTHAIPPTGNKGFIFCESSFHKSTLNLVNVMEREGRGHPGYLTRCVETGLTYLTQTEAALANGIHPTRMSDHLNGRLSHVGGLHFERICMAA